MTMDSEQETFALEQKQQREIVVVCIEEHIAAMEKAALILVSSLERQRELVEKLKKHEGWDWKVEAPSALFGDAVLFRELEVALQYRDLGESE